MATQLSLREEEQLREDYLVSSLKVREICKKWDISERRFYKIKDLRGWPCRSKMGPRETRALRQAEEEAGEEEMDKWAARHLEAREDLYSIAQKAISDFKEAVDAGERPVKDWATLKDVISTLDKALDRPESGALPVGAQFAVDINLLSSGTKLQGPRVIDVDAAD